MAKSTLFFENTEKKHLKPDLLSDYAKKCLNEFVKTNQKNLSQTQLRKFYNDILSIKHKIDVKADKEEAFKKELPYIKMLKAKVAYAKHRKHATDEFEHFINTHINEIKDIDDFYAFCDLFQAIIAYSPSKLKK
ncbi:type III-A CRISPR-associated protein Csm2 [Deferribacter abyssi]|uniref:type III-A CRISPR-associated protein Csm2 n=1 Tax=Deferribacter abyssi TaxID=213806 RepID=UPI003C2A8B5B